MRAKHTTRSRFVLWFQWSVITAVGVAASSFIWTTGLRSWPLLIIGGLHGLLIGVLQWPLLRWHLPHARWWSWPIASVGGWSLGWFLGSLIGSAIGFAVFSPSMSIESALLSIGLLGFAVGVVVGIALAFSRLLEYSWTVTMSVSGALGFVWAVTMGLVVLLIGSREFVTWAMCGILAGISQGIILQRQVLPRISWWVWMLASFLGWTLGGLLGNFVIAHSYNLLSAPFLSGRLGGAIIGGVGGMITGATLVWLLETSKSHKDEQA